MKRWYKTAAVVPAGDGWGVMLDGKPVSTPARTLVTASTQALAQALAEEWEAQRETIVPPDMRLTRLIATALDLIRPDPRPAIAEIVNYAGSDLLCHRADAPADLRALQDTTWQPILDWAAKRFGATLCVATGVMPQNQPGAALLRLHAHVEQLDYLMLAGLHGATTTSGSLLLALALAERHIDADQAWAAVDLDEAYQRARWGDDPLAAKRRVGVEADLRAAARFLDLLRD